MKKMYRGNANWPAFGVCLIISLLLGAIYATIDTTSTDKPAFDGTTLPKVLSEILAVGDKVLTVERTVAGNNAWVIQPAHDPTEMVVAYTDDSGKYVFHGALYYEGKDGVADLTRELEDKHRPIIDLQALWPEVEKSTWYADGANDEEAKFTMYGFFDPNCIYCHLSWLSLEPYFKAGLQVRWIPVAVIGQTSAQKSARLMTGGDFAAKMAFGHKKWEAGRDKAFPLLNDIPADTAKRIEENNLLMRTVGATGTPAFLWKDAAGKVHKASGLIPPREIPRLTGLPFQENDNPKLKEFD